MTGHGPENPAWAVILRRLPFALLLLTAACGARGSSKTYDSQARLVDLVFPDPVDINPEPEDRAPAAASLIQSIELHFNGRPDPDRVSQATIEIRDLSGAAVPGRYEVEGRVVRFTPRLPIREAAQIGAITFDNGGAGLEPLSTYTVRVGPASFSFVEGVSEELLERFPDPTDAHGVLARFSTTGVLGDFFRGLEPRRPRLARVEPTDGSVDVSPGLYTDPQQLFPEPRPFLLEFDAPLHPAACNLERVLLVDLDDRPAEFPAGLPLGVHVRMLRNEVDGSALEVEPSGILPLGHLLSLEFPAEIAALSDEEPCPEDDLQIAATFHVSADPGGDIRDAFVEDFDTTEDRGEDPADIEVGQLFAEWDERDSNVLQASFAFEHAGVLGRFIPSPPTGSDPKNLVLDTSRQVFPLYDGSTPDAPPGYEVVGGVFPFSEIDIPDGVVLDVRGPNPLILTATGSIRVSGQILSAGEPGVHENSFDSAVTSLPGGNARGGGGRGGEGQPILHFPSNEISNLTLVSPPRGGRGFGPGNLARLGGHGGQSGYRDHPDGNGDYGTDSEVNCVETQGHNNGYKPPGGGGGSMLVEGMSPKKPGYGNVLCDGAGGWIVRTPESHGNNYDTLEGGPPGDRVFADAEDDNDFFGTRGERWQIIGGQGGGSGGSGLDAYMCGSWCLLDADPTNDAICQAEFGFPPTYAGSVGDSRGGSGGAGGGAVVLRSLGAVEINSKAIINCRGGAGGNGEQIGCGNWSGSGGGGAGGAIVIQSATSIEVRGEAALNVLGGTRGLATVENEVMNTGCSSAPGPKNPGSGGRGSQGIIQLQVPVGDTATVSDDADFTDKAWVDPDNTLNPAAFGAIRVALSRWVDFGRTIERSPKGTRPAFQFRGLDSAGQVITDAEGMVLDPANTDVRCDYLGQLDPLDPGQYLPGEEPRADFVPPNASVTLAFQAADAIADGSREVDPASFTPWSPTPTVADGHQFIRYRITFDLRADGSDLRSSTPRPAVQEVDLRAEF